MQELERERREGEGDWEEKERDCRWKGREKSSLRLEAPLAPGPKPLNTPSYSPGGLWQWSLGSFAPPLSDLREMTQWPHPQAGRGGEGEGEAPAWSPPSPPQPRQPTGRSCPAGLSGSAETDPSPPWFGNHPSVSGGLESPHACLPASTLTLPIVCAPRSRWNDLLKLQFRSRHPGSKRSSDFLGPQNQIQTPGTPSSVCGPQPPSST